MTWFRVDDGLHSHRKAVRAGVPAMGLWVLAGSWCADHLTDGFIPDYMAGRLDPAYEEHAARLVAAELWEPAERGGDKGWQFHEWTEQQPTREQVMADRKANADRQERFRQRANAKRAAATASAVTASAERDASVSNGGSNAVTNAATNGVTNASVTPTRPDPTRPVVPSELQNPPPVGARTGTSQQPSLDGMPDPPPFRSPTASDRAFGLARWWLDVRERADAPVVATTRKAPLHMLKSLIEPFVEHYTNDEIQQALIRARQGIPSKQQLDRVLSEARTGERSDNRQGRRSGGMGSGQPPPGRITDSHADVAAYMKRI